MRAIWSGTVRSSSRLDRVTGLAAEYRMVIYDNGQASCTCPSFMFSGLRNPSLSDEQKLRFRCKHLVQAFAAQQGPQLARDARATRATQAAGDPPVGAPAASPDPDPDPDDFDDDEYVAPQVRR